MDHLELRFLITPYQAKHKVIRVSEYLRANYTTTSLNFTRIAIPAVPANRNTSGSDPVLPSLCPKTPDGEECPPAPPP